MQIFTEEVFQKDNFLAFTATHKDLGKFEDTRVREKLKTKSSTLKNYKIIYLSYFNRSFQNTTFIQLVYYSFFIRLSFRPKIIPKIAKM